MADRIVVMNDARIQQAADPLTIATRPATELVARFMGDNNILRGTVSSKEGDRLIVDTRQGFRFSVRADATELDVGDEAAVAVRAATLAVGDDADVGDLNSVECEIVFVEFLGDLVKLHLEAGDERILAKVTGDRYPSLRGREGERIRVSWNESDVQPLAG